MNRLPRVKNFLHSEATKYPAATVEWVGGHAPEVHFLDKHKKVVERHDLSPLGEEQIHALLAQKGITISTPTPEYVPPTFNPTDVCVAWRQTGNCDPNGEREPLADESCFTAIAPGRSGYCECRARPNVEYMCEHLEFTCEELCRESTEGTAPSADDEDNEEF